MGDHHQNNPNIPPETLTSGAISGSLSSTSSSSAPEVLTNVTPSATPEDLATIATLVNTAAEHRRGQPVQLLALLRLLESLHRDIRDGYFQEALPDNRQALYALLKDIEAEGGWPYIYRRRLEDFARALSQCPIAEGDGNQAGNRSS